MGATYESDDADDELAVDSALSPDDRSSWSSSSSVIGCVVVVAEGTDEDAATAAVAAAGTGGSMRVSIVATPLSFSVATPAWLLESLLSAIAYTTESQNRLRIITSQQDDEYRNDRE